MLQIFVFLIFPVPFRPYLKLCKANKIKENSSGEKDPSEVNKVILELAQGEFRNQDNGELNPIEYYKKFMNNKLLHKIVDESNKYAIQSNPSSPLNLNRNELEQFCGILYVMSLVKMLSTKLHWSSEFNYDKVASIMTIN